MKPAGPLSFSHFISPQTGQANVPVQNIAPDNLDQAVSQHIRQVLAKAGGKIHGAGGAAELLGINPSTLRNRMNKLGIEYKKGWWGDPICKGSNSWRDSILDCFFFESKYDSTLLFMIKIRIIILLSHFIFLIDW